MSDMRIMRITCVNDVNSCSTRSQITRTSWQSDRAVSPTHTHTDRQTYLGRDRQTKREAGADEQRYYWQQIRQTIYRYSINTTDVMWHDMPPATATLKLRPNDAQQITKHRLRSTGSALDTSIYVDRLRWSCLFQLVTAILHLVQQ